MVRTLGREAGVENCYPHRLRHTFCHALLTPELYGSSRKALPLHVVRDLCGHASIQTTADIYARLTDAHIEELMAWADG